MVWTARPVGGTIQAFIARNLPRQGDELDASPPEPLTRKDTAADLKAAVEARRELGGELEEHVLEAFLARVQQRIDLHVAEQIALSGRRSPAGQRKGGMAGWVLPSSLAVSIPLVGVAGFFGGGFGVLVVMVAVIALTAIWLDYSKR